MDFTSFSFFIFFPLTVAIYYISPRSARRPFLLVASYLFYFVFVPLHALLLAATTLLDYGLALRLAAAPGAVEKRRWLLAGLAHNILLLAGFKYLGFLAGILTPWLGPLADAPAALTILAPVGISYFTFKKIGYLIEVQRGAPAERNLLSFALYVAFFPSVMAGPIDRAKNLLPQFNRPAMFSGQYAAEGLQLMAWGFFKKLIIADRLAAYVGRAYDQPALYSGPGLVAATFYFSIQIYCDFSGYTDIARGAARVFGYDLLENFRQPYFATSIGDFWKRWHISLSSWLMEFVFLPLAYATSRRIRSSHLLGVRAETWAYLTGIGLTMLLCGLWHGPSWTFVIWGGLHGLFMAASFITRRARRRIVSLLGLKRVPAWLALLRGLFTFIMVSFAWIFFRAATPADALAIVGGLFRGWEAVFHPAFLPGLLTFGLLKKELAVAGVASLLLLLADWQRRERPIEIWTATRLPLLRWTIYVLLLLAVLTFGDAATEAFIYFRF